MSSGYSANDFSIVSKREPDDHTSRRCRDRARHRVQTRSRTVRLDDGRRGLDDRFGHLHRLRRHCAAGRKSRVAADGLDHYRRPHADGGSFLRRARGDDAARRRTVRLPPRGVLAALGIPLRMDALPRHPDRHDCGGERGVRAVPRRSLADHRRGPLPDSRRFTSRQAMPCRCRPPNSSRCS